MSITPPNLGTVIPNAFARKLIYGTYVIALVLAGALQVWFIDPDPQWLTQTVGVLTYLGIPVGTLALANAPMKTDKDAIIRDAIRAFETPGPNDYRTKTEQLADRAASRSRLGLPD